MIGGAGLVCRGGAGEDTRELVELVLEQDNTGLSCV